MFDSSPDQVIFEAFEASPRNEDVLAADNALQWDFPGCAVAIPLTTFNDEDFRLSLATFLEQASLETTKMFAAHTFKAGAEIFEYRDTANPTMISSMLMAILEENGQRISTPPLRKRIRDDICWSNAEKPWRRLPHWLVLRVAIARRLSLMLGGELGRFEYKFFMCICFSRFLESAEPTLAADEVEFMKTKLCRRLVKLDVDRTGVQDKFVSKRVDGLFEDVSPGINRVIRTANYRVRSEWEAFKQASKKTIPLLPKQASLSDLTLPLRVSGQVLEEMQAMSTKRMMRPNPKWTTPPDFDLSSVTNEHFSKYAKPFFDLSKQEYQLQHLGLGNPQGTSPSDFITSLSHLIRQYVDKALPLYRGNPGQMSLLILNAMELWVELDTCICRVHPLVREYHPVFTPEILDVLHLANYHDMVRLQKIQSYLRMRIKGGHHSRINVFEDPCTACFAVRYYDEMPEASEMHAMHQEIKGYAHGMKQSKRQEWEGKCAEFERLTKQVDESTCIYIADDFDPLGRGQHIESQCPRCRIVRRLSQMKIQIYEHPLPSDIIAAKVVLFELLCPRDFSSYRDTTWMIISRLASSVQAKGVAPKCLLRDYTQLSSFFRHNNSTFTLASVTKSCKFRSTSSWR